MDAPSQQGSVEPTLLQYYRIERGLPVIGLVLNPEAFRAHLSNFLTVFLTMG